MKMVVYTKTGCPWCGELLVYLKRNNLPFEEKNVTLNSAFRQELMEKTGQTKAPTVEMEGEILADTSAEEVADYLSRKK